MMWDEAKYRKSRVEELGWIKNTISEIFIIRPVDSFGPTSRSNTAEKIYHPTGRFFWSDRSIFEKYEK